MLCGVRCCVWCVSVVCGSLLFGVCYLLRVVCCSLFGVVWCVCYLLFVVCCLIYVVYCVLLAVLLFVAV